MPIFFPGFSSGASAGTSYSYSYNGFVLANFSVEDVEEYPQKIKTEKILR